jgi:hypothetical protein
VVRTLHENRDQTPRNVASDHEQTPQTYCRPDPHLARLSGKCASIDLRAAGWAHRGVDAERLTLPSFRARRRRPPLDQRSPETR